MADEKKDDGLDQILTKITALGEKSDSKALVELVTQLYRDNFDLRSKNRDLTKQAEDAGKRVPEGAIVLTGDEAKAVAALRERKIALTDVPTKLDELGTTASENATLKRTQAAAEAAEVLGWKPKLLQRIAKQEGLDLKITEVKDKDDPEKIERVPVVVGLDDDDEPVEIPLSDYVTQHLAEFADVLPVSEAERVSRREPPVPGTRLPRQRSGDEGAKRGPSPEQLEAQARQKPMYRF